MGNFDLKNSHVKGLVLSNVWVAGKTNFSDNVFDWIAPPTGLHFFSARQERNSVSSNGLSGYGFSELLKAF